MEIERTGVEGVNILQPEVFEDERGFFFESYNKEKLEKMGINLNLCQDNHSMSKEIGTIRGLHYQIEPMEMTKIVRVVRGEILDVIVDIRKGSPTFGEWSSFHLTSENKKQVIVPPGFAHGFCTLVRDTEVLYKVDKHYSREHDRGIKWNDPEIGIDWPTSNPILSEKDMKNPPLSSAEINFTYEG